MDGRLAQARELTHGFLDLIRHHNAEGLDIWLKDVRASTIREFLSFARSVQQDKAAILAGLTLPYSTGPVEGHINQLKLIKRQAYGRAGLSYLQRRFAAFCLTDVVKAVTRSLHRTYFSRKRVKKGVHVVRISRVRIN